MNEFSEGTGERRPVPVPARRVAVTLSPELAARLRRYADRHHKKSLDDAAEYLLSRALDRPLGDGAPGLPSIRDEVIKELGDTLGHSILDS
jgi:hypothetical protein